MKGSKYTHGLFLLLSLFIATPTAKIHKLSQERHFIHQGNLYLVRDRADLIVDLDLTPIRSQIFKVCSLAKTLTQPTEQLFIKPLKARFQVLCKQDKKRWTRLAAMATGGHLNGTEDAAGVDKRFIGALFLSLAAGIGGAVWEEHQTHEDLLRLAQEQNRIITVAKEAESRLTFDEAHISSLETLLQQERISVIQQGFLMEGLMATMATFAAQDRELSRLEILLGHIFETKKWPAGMLLTGAIRTHLQDIYSRTRAQGKTLLVKDEMDLTNCPLSFGTSSSLTFRVMVHLPVASAEDKYQILRYLNTPFPIDNYAGSGAVTRMAHSLIVATSSTATKTGRGFVVTPSVMGSWSSARDFLFTSDDITVRKWGQGQGSCVEALLTSNSTMFLAHCEVEEATDDVEAWRLLGDQWAVCFPRPERAALTCNKRLEFSGVLAGCHEVELTPGCKLDSTSIQLTGTRTVTATEFRLRIPDISISAEELTHLREAERTLEQKAVIPKRKPQQILHSARQLHPVKISGDWWSTSAPVWSLLALLAGGLACWTTIFCRNGCSRYRRSRSRNVQHITDFQEWVEGSEESHDHHRAPTKDRNVHLPLRPLHRTSRPSSRASETRKTESARPDTAELRSESSRTRQPMTLTPTAPCLPFRQHPDPVTAPHPCPPPFQHGRPGTSWQLRHPLQNHQETVPLQKVMTSPSSVESPINYDLYPRQRGTDNPTFMWNDVNGNSPTLYHSPPQSAIHRAARHEQVPSGGQPSDSPSQRTAALLRTPTAPSTAVTTSLPLSTTTRNGNVSGCSDKPSQQSADTEHSDEPEKQNKKKTEQQQQNSTESSVSAAEVTFS